MAEIKIKTKKIFSKKGPSYFYLIGNCYYFRYRLPKDYQKHLGRKEIRLHLGSSQLAQARKRAYQCYAQIQNYLEALQMPRAKNKNIPQLSLSDELGQASAVPKEPVEFDLPWDKFSTDTLPTAEALMGSKKKIENFFKNIEQHQMAELMSKEKMHLAAQEEKFKDFPYCFDFDAANKEAIDLPTIERRMQGLLRYLLDEDRASLKPRQESHSAYEVFAGMVIVDIDENLSHINYLARYEKFYSLFINRQDSIVQSMEGFERLLLQHQAVRECEITRDNVLYVINEYCKIMVTYYQVLQARAEFDYSKEKTACSSDYISYPPTFEEEAIPLVPMPKISTKLPQKKAEQKSIEEDTGMKTSEFIALYAKYKLSDGKWRNKQASTTHLQRLQFLVDILGDLPINSINHAYRREFFESLKKLPKHHRSAKYHNFSMKKLLAMEDTEKLSPKSINTILLAISSMFTWGMAEGLLEVNPFKSLSIPDNRNEKDLRSTFTTDDLQKLFSTQAIQKAKNSEKPSRYWVPYIGLYTGMRLSEIAQLYIEDIKIYSEDGKDYWYFDVTTQNADDKSLKAKYSARVVPVHDRLIELGFLEFFQDQKKAKHKRLFPEITITASKGRYGHAITRFFSDLVKREGIEGKKTFHSLRHNFAEFFEKNDLKSNAFKQVFGHTADDLASKQYGSKFTVKECYDKVISHLRFEV